jgi:hypothetical protein
MQPAASGSAAEMAGKPAPTVIAAIARLNSRLFILY